MPHTSFEIGPIVLNLVLVIILVLLNGFFVAAEFALVKVRHSRIQQLLNEGSSKAKYADKVTSELDTYLSATQLGITLASLGLGWVGEPAVSELIMEPLFHMLGLEASVYTHAISFIFAFGFITFLHIVLGELAPKSFAIQKAELTSLWLSAPLLYFYRLFRPIIWVLNGAANKFLSWIGVEPASEHEAAHTEEEIRILMDESVKSGHIDQDEMVLFDNIFEFSERIAREVMLPRTDMDCLYLEMSFIENLRMVHETKHTRYPVADEDKDRIVGFVHITDLFTADPDVEHEISEFIRPILNVPESMEVSRVLKLMQKKHSQLAIVVDEYGGTAGLLTLEDIMEEIVGELHDEFDIDERPEVEVKDKYTSVDGRVLIEDLNDMLDLEIEDEDVDSIGGWLFKKLEGAPVKGKRVASGNHVFEVSEVDRLRIVRIHITKINVIKPGNE
ncbi:MULTISPECIES: hemolysin family protein [Paenibacillus]|uniref:Hemolysin family protein n=2 Tax=Paenibacillus TaxID=44249 RepID=A0ABU3RLS9_9BACL|nr:MULTISPECIES: hemolysin family protein [Paenibacillus]MCY9661232.1 hemolysin family protein [Paenibacillus anseongense]MDU0205251.1 hemolysin family protein [Paenibacillus sp. PFR10]MEB4797350.1 hemolysin family protein [Paenibacillus chondroitinus]MEC0271012.1 hemolysin family protein [Paenibacillus anseongense]